MVLLTDSNQIKVGMVTPILHTLYIDHCPICTLQ